jgi:hypothetical protein
MDPAFALTIGAFPVAWLLVTLAWFARSSD